MKDMKEALSNARKADTTHVRSGIRRYIARTCEYGTAKGYERGNYLRATGEAAHVEPTGADFDRLTAYLRASIDHATATLDSMERHRAGDPKLVDVVGMQRAAYAGDTDQSNAFPASGLPHLCGAAASLMMAIEQAIDCGLLPADPGTPWASPMNQLKALATSAPRNCHPLPAHEARFAAGDMVFVAPNYSAQIEAVEWSAALSTWLCNVHGFSSKYREDALQPVTGVAKHGDDLAGLAARTAGMTGYDHARMEEAERNIAKLRESAAQERREHLARDPRQADAEKID